LAQLVLAKALCVGAFLQSQSETDLHKQFIEAAAGKPAGEIGHSLELSTKDVQFVSCPYPKGDKQVFFVDTPGLHEEGNTWQDVGLQIQKWIKM
jgi:hypothetical protein